MPFLVVLQAAQHSTDPSLLALLASRRNVHVVTRNRHFGQIKEFIVLQVRRGGTSFLALPLPLSQRLMPLLMVRQGGDPALFTVHSVKLGAESSKAAVITAVLEQTAAAAGPGQPPPSLFVDDDISEHFRDGLPAIASRFGLRRMLFVRG